MNKIYWFTDSYRKKAAKFQNNLLNEGKVTFPCVDCCRAGSYVMQGHTAHRAVATTQKRFFSATCQVRPYVCRRFVVTVFERARDEGRLEVHEVVYAEGDRGVVEPASPATGIVFGGGYRCNFGFFASIRLYVFAVILGIAGDRGRRHSFLILSRPDLFLRAV